LFILPDYSRNSEQTSDAMIVNKLKLSNFRNHKNLSLEIDPATTFIIGDNGVGKTNILEALHMLSTSKSFRARYDSDVINYPAKFSTIKASIKTSDEKYDLELQVSRRESGRSHDDLMYYSPKEDTKDESHTSTKKVKVNGVPKSIFGFAGIFKSVLFTPQNIDVITGSPAERRKYIDSILFQIDKTYKRIHNNYTKALKQRNKLLERIREERKGYDQLGYWENILEQTGSDIHKMRSELLSFLNKNSKGYGRTLNSGYSEIEIKYKKSLITKDRFDEYRNKEIAAKSTLIGPHKDDFIIEYNNYRLSDFGSRGQQRTVLVALKMCETDYIEEKTKETPVLLLDDIFSELDKKHREILISMAPKQQTIITTTELPVKNAFVINL